MTIQARIDQLADHFAKQFAAAVVAELRGASLADLGSLVGTAPTKKTAARASRGRRTTAQVEQDLGRVIKVLKAGPMRSEQILKAIGMPKREWLSVVKLGLATKKLKKKGQKRATTYSA